MKQKQHFFFYFKNSLHFLFTHQILVALLFIIEYLDIYTHTLDMSIQLLHYNHPYLYSNNNITKCLFYISPYYYFNTYICGDMSASNYHKEIGIAVIVILLMLFIILLLKQSNIKVSKVSIFTKILMTLFINFYEYLFFRTLSILPLHILNENILKYARVVYGSYNPLDVFLIILLSLLGFLVVFVYVKYFLTFNVLSTFKFHETIFNAYPFDNFFSLKYDIILFFVKILIATSHNNLALNDNVISSFQMFVNLIVLILLFAFSFRLIYHFFINKHDLCKLFISEGNIIRVFLLIFTCVSVILRLMFNSNELCKLFVTFSLLMLVFLLYIIIANFSSYITSQVEMSNNYFGVCWFFQGNDIERTKFIMQWIIHHRTLCVVKNCHICLKLNEEERTSMKGKSDNCNNIQAFNSNEEEGKLMRSGHLYSSFSFVELLYKEYLRTVDQNANKEKPHLVDMIYLTLLFLSKTPQLFKLYIFVNNLERKYKQNTNVLLTVMMSFELIKKAHKDSIKTYKLLKKSEILNNAIKEYIKHFESFLHYDCKTPENFVKISNQFMEIKDNREELKDLIKKDAKCNYQTRVIRYLYEAILRSPLKILHVESEIYSSEEYLDLHYLNDQLCLLRYSIERGTFTIIKASKDLFKYKNKAFNTIFPDFLKKRNEETLLERLKSCDVSDNKKLMSFVVKDLQQIEEYGFVQDFKMVYSVFPSIVSDEMLISISYLIDFDDILIFEMPNERNDECLFSCSKSFLKILGLTTEIIQLLYKANKIITFQDVFSKKLINFQLTNSNCVLSYAKYAKVYSELMKFDGLNETHNFNDIKDNVNKIREMGKEQKEVTFIITEKFINENDKSKYIIYNLVEKNKEKDTKRAKDITIIGMDNEIVIDPLSKFEQGQTTTLAPTVSHFSTDSCSSGRGSLNSMYKKKNNRDERKEKYQQVHYFTWLIFSFGLFLMILTLVFLILEVNKNMTFQSLFNLFQLFKAFKRSIECIPLSIISNFCIESFDGTCVNYFKEYSVKVQEEYPPLADFPYLNEVISAEVNEKYGTIIINFNVFLSEMYRINFDSINEIGTFQLTVLNIKKEGDKLSIEKTVSSFLDLVRLYSNFVTTILTNNAYLKEGVRIMILSDDGKIHLEDKEITEIQRFLYRLILNYPYLHQGILKSSDIIETEFSSYLKEINSILLAFFLVLLILHLLLCFFTLCFLRIFFQMLKTNIGSIIDLFSNQSYIDFIGKRMNLIKQLSELYSDNPIKIIHEITQKEEDYKKAQRDLLVTQKQDAQSNSLPVQPERVEYNITEKEFNKIILNHKIVIVVLFTVYIIYSVCYYLVLNDNFTHLKYLVSYTSANSLIDNYIYDNVLAIQYIFLTNSTSNTLGELVFEDKSIDYIKYGIETLYTALEMKEIIETDYGNIFPPLHESTNMNCSQFQISDTTFKSALEKMGYNYSHFLKTVCEYFKFQMLATDENIIKEILYMSNQLINKYSQGTYEALIGFYRNRVEYDLYCGTLIFTRIVRSYFNEKFFNEKVNDVLVSFSVLIIIYLVLNMVLEIVIFLILNFLVISRIRLMNKKLFLFINSLKY